MLFSINPKTAIYMTWVAWSILGYLVYRQYQIDVETIKLLSLERSLLNDILEKATLDIDPTKTYFQIVEEIDKTAMSLMQERFGFSVVESAFITEYIVTHQLPYHGSLEFSTSPEGSPIPGIYP